MEVAVGVAVGNGVGVGESAAVGVDGSVDVALRVDQGSGPPQASSRNSTVNARAGCASPTGKGSEATPTSTSAMGLPPSLLLWRYIPDWYKLVTTSGSVGGSSWTS